MKFGLNEATINRLHSVFQKYPEISEVVIYGSRAKGNYREDSDIDITLKGEQITEVLRRDIWLDLDDLNTPYLIDLSVYHHLTSDSLKEHINRIGKEFYSKTRKSQSLKIVHHDKS